MAEELELKRSWTSSEEFRSAARAQNFATDTLASSKQGTCSRYPAFQQSLVHFWGFVEGTKKEEERHLQVQEGATMSI